MTYFTYGTPDIQNTWKLNIKKLIWDISRKTETIWGICKQATVATRLLDRPDSSVSTWVTPNFAQSHILKLLAMELIKNKFLHYWRFNITKNIGRFLSPSYICYNNLKTALYCDLCNGFTFKWDDHIENLHRQYSIWTTLYHTRNNAAKLGGRKPNSPGYNISSFSPQSHIIFITCVKTLSFYYDYLIY